MNEPCIPKGNQLPQYLSKFFSTPYVEAAVKDVCLRQGENWGSHVLWDGDSWTPSQFETTAATT